MRRLATVLACVLSLPALAIAQTQAPATPAKYVRPVKGTATVDVVKTPTKRVAGELVTVIKVKNTSAGAINLLKVDEYWYNAKREMVSGGQYAHKKAPILPGEIVEITVKSPDKGNPQVNMLMFRHANGEIKATSVKAFK